MRHMAKALVGDTAWLLRAIRLKRLEWPFASGIRSPYGGHDCLWGCDGINITGTDMQFEVKI